MKLKTLLKKAYKENMFWIIEPFKNKEKDPGKALEIELQGTLAEIEDKDAFRRYLEARAKVLYKRMVFEKEQETDMNRGRLIEVLSMRQAFNKLDKEK